MRTKGVAAPEGQVPERSRLLRFGTLLTHHLLGAPSVQPNHAPPGLPLFLPPLPRPALSRRDHSTRALTLWPREAGPQLGRDQHFNHTSGKPLDVPACQSMGEQAIRSRIAECLVEDNDRRATASPFETIKNVVRTVGADLPGP